MRLTRYNRIIILTIIVVFVVSLSIVFWQQAVRYRRAQCVEFTGEWIINEESDNIITLTRRMEDQGDVSSPSVFFKTMGSAVEVMLNDEKIYENGMGNYSSGEFVGKMVHFVNLPHDYAGKDLKIILHTGKNTKMADATTPLFGSHPNLFRLYLQASIPALAGGCFLLVFGVIFLFLTTALSIRMPGTAQHIVAALICTVMGIWMLNAYDMSLILRGQTFETLFEHISFYLIWPLFCMLLYYIYDGNRKLRYCSAAGFAACGVILLLHGAGIVSVDTFAPVYEVVFVIAIIILIYHFFRFRYGEYTEPSVAAQERGIVILAFCVLVHVTFSLIRRVIHDPSFGDNNQVAILGCFVFATTQILNYYLNISESYARRKEYSSLNQLAYVDVLTGLPNRKSAQNVMRGLNNAYGNYCIISFDLNGLKEMNDVYGHSEGDRMLKNTADVLNDVFGDKGFRARLGGDEFTVVLKRVDRETVKKMCEKVNEELIKIGRLAVGVDHSISFGFAFRDECPDAPSDEVFRLADERMYRMKEAHHERRDRILRR